MCRQAALRCRPREALLNSADDPGRPSLTTSRGSPSPRAQSLEECPHCVGVLLRAGHEVEQNLATVLADAPGGDHRLTRLASAQPLGNPIDLSRSPARETASGRSRPMASSLSRFTAKLPPLGNFLRSLDAIFDLRKY